MLTPGPVSLSPAASGSDTELSVLSSTMSAYMLPRFLP
ncbi:rCG35748 [Rattus norvegicus]|uniref:RCG35748 n=1 Tax=Rattus norvegicus TaxID=10116 RepID=A6IJM6_RAT|nr:rCG35748 [Rattus norvegicus]